MRSSRCQDNTAATAVSKSSGRSPSTVTVAIASVLLVVGAGVVEVVDSGGRVVEAGGAVVESRAASGSAAGVDVQAAARSVRATMAEMAGLSRFTVGNRTRVVEKVRGPR